MNLEQARINMIEQQIRTWDVFDQRVLDTIAAVPREEFVPQHLRNLAFADTGIPIGHGQFMMAPKVEARMLQALDLRRSDRVLEIGTGSGYVTALLASLAAHVTSIDIYEDFVAGASTHLGKLGLANVVLEAGDGLHGWPARAPYDAIAVTGSVPELPAGLTAQLAPEGRLFAVIGRAPVMQAQLLTRIGEKQWATEILFETELAPLLGAQPRPRFTL